MMFGYAWAMELFIGLTQSRRNANLVSRTMMFGYAWVMELFIGTQFDFSEVSARAR